MQTIEQCYESISQDTAKWSYYDNPPVTIDHIWHNKENAFAFIKNYFNYAGKSRVFEDKYLSRNDEHIIERAAHTISTFLLGIKLAEYFGFDLGVNNEHNMNLKYYWFLACLYHDIGYAYEKNRNRYHERTVYAEGIEALQEIYGVKYVPDRIFRTYLKNIVEFYLKCRANPNEGTPVIDHGIAGGIMLYDKLRNQFKRAWKNRTEKSDLRESFYVRNEATGRCLHLSNSHFDDYAVAADAIITHNIWKSTLRMYLQKYPTIAPAPYVEKRGGIGIDNKICFLLSLADTLEPLKKGIPLQNVTIGEISGTRGVELQLDHNAYDIMARDFATLDTWINVSVITNVVDGDMKSVRIIAK